jgi:hypothetical protein
MPEGLIDSLDSALRIGGIRKKLRSDPTDDISMETEQPTMRHMCLCTVTPGQYPPRNTSYFLLPLHLTGADTAFVAEQLTSSDQQPEYTGHTTPLLARICMNVRLACRPGNNRLSSVRILALKAEGNRNKRGSGDAK